jgi:hypothetical protein
MGGNWKKVVSWLVSPRLAKVRAELEERMRLPHLVWNQRTGEVLGVFNAEWPHEALDMAMQAGGYADFDAAVRAHPSLKDDLAVREMEWEP